MYRLLLLASCCLNASVVGSELHPVDLRVSLLRAPETENVDVSYSMGNVGAYGSTDSIDAGWRFEAGLVTSIHELSPNLHVIGGVWFFYSDQENDAVAPGSREISVMTGPMNYTTMGIDLYLALNLKMGHYFEAELGPVVGLGTTRYTDSGVEAGDPDGRVEETGHGEYEEIGLNLAVLVRNTSRSVVVGLGVRYLGSHGEAENSFRTEDDNGNAGEMVQQVEIYQHGFMPYVTVGATF